MSKTPETPAPQQQGGTSTAPSQMGSPTKPAPQQGQAPIIRDWASF